MPQGFWQQFMEEVGQLSLRHPYVARPSAKNYCTWAACFGLGAVVGLFCISPDAGGCSFLGLGGSGLSGRGEWR
jgi:hypothetical protein